MSSQLAMSLPSIAQSELSVRPLLWRGTAPTAVFCVATYTTVCCRHEDRVQTGMSLTLTNLAPAPLVLLRPIPVTVQQEDGVYVASFEDANVNASGETLDDALDMLKEMIVFTYEEFSEDESALGVGAQNQMAILKRFVRT